MTTERRVQLEQTVALKGATGRLTGEFGEHFENETIDRTLHSSYSQLAGGATVGNFLPLLAERFARLRLSALSKLEGVQSESLPTVLFLCADNSGCSQLALGFFQHLAGDRAVAGSAGIDPGIVVDPAAIMAMKEVGIDISSEFPKPWTTETVRAADLVVSIGCGETCPVFPGPRYQEWLLDDRGGDDVDELRPIRDQLEQRVRRLLGELGVPVG